MAPPIFATIFSMDAKDKALKIAVGAVVALALAMFLYYWFAWRNRTTVHDLNLQEKVESAPEEKDAFAGMYSAVDPIEGMERRLNFFTVSKKDDGSGGYFGSAKVDRVASTEAAEEYIKCPEVNIAEKDFFLKCFSPELGQLSFVGEWDKSSGSLQVKGKALWSKDGTVLTDKATTLTHISAH
jgi:hypothetical protein